MDFPNTRNGIQNFVAIFPQLLTLLLNFVVPFFSNNTKLFRDKYPSSAGIFRRERNKFGFSQEILFSNSACQPQLVQPISELS